jgi:hypothetical protein
MSHIKIPLQLQYENKFSLSLDKHTVSIKNTECDLNYSTKCISAPFPHDPSPAVKGDYAESLFLLPYLWGKVQEIRCLSNTLLRHLARSCMVVSWSDTLIQVKEHFIK